MDASKNGGSAEPSARTEMTPASICPPSILLAVALNFGAGTVHPSNLLLRVPQRSVRESWVRLGGNASIKDAGYYVFGNGKFMLLTFVSLPLCARIHVRCESVQHITRIEA